MEPGDPLPRPSRLSQLACTLTQFTHNSPRVGRRRSWIVDPARARPRPCAHPLPVRWHANGTQPITTASNERALGALAHHISRESSIYGESAEDAYPTRQMKNYVASYAEQKTPPKRG
jgi:hypothetical protein